ncbi:MAG: AAA family ATPase [Bacteroidota bacterium]
MNQTTEKLKAVLAHVKSTFVGKDEVVDLLGIALIAKENAFLLGPPGTAKSAIVRQLSSCIEGGKNFEYLLTRFTEPNEIFGPFDIRKLKDGLLVTNVEGMMPEAAVVFLDEIFNANSAILNSLLMALNERIFRRGKETIQLPALMFVGASNVLPEDEALNALLDRFLLRVRCDYVSPDLLSEVLLAGWQLENNHQQSPPTIHPDEIRTLQTASKQVDLTPVRKQYIEVIQSIRTTGIKVSDRRAVKIQNLIAASALICNRQEAQLSDLWVMKYIWDTEEQIEILNGIVNNIIEQEAGDHHHPQASTSRLPNPETLMKELQTLQKNWEQPDISFKEKNRIKDKLRYLQSRTEWIQNSSQKAKLTETMESLWASILAEA